MEAGAPTPSAGAEPGDLSAISPHPVVAATDADAEGVLDEPSHPTPELHDLAEAVAVAPLSDDQPQLLAESGWLEATAAAGNGSEAATPPSEPAPAVVVAAPSRPRRRRRREPPPPDPDEEGILAEPALSASPPPAPEEKAIVRKRRPRSAPTDTAPPAPVAQPTPTESLPVASEPIAPPVTAPPSPSAAVPASSRRVVRANAFAWLLASTATLLAALVTGWHFWERGELELPFLPPSPAVVAARLTAAAGVPRQTEMVLVISNRDESGVADLYTIAAQGSAPTNLTRTPHAIEFEAAFSPQRDRIVVSVLSNYDEPVTELHTMRADGSDRQLLLRGPANTILLGLSWSRDGQRIAYSQVPLAADAPPQLFVIGATGGTPQPLGGLAGWGASWSPDGSQLLFTASERPGGGEGPALCVAGADGGHPRAIVAGRALLGAWSPDGRQIAYVGYWGEVGQTQPDLFVVHADGSNPRQLTRTDDLECGVRWSRDGQRVFFTRLRRHPSGRIDPDEAELCAVDIETLRIEQLTNDDRLDLSGAVPPETLPDLVPYALRPTVGPATDPSLANLKQLATALMMCVADQEGRFPAMRNALELRQSLLLYLNDRRPFVHPTTREPYQPNPRLSGLAVKQIASPGQVLALWEASPAADGTRAVVFADGHARRIAEAEWPRLRSLAERPTTRPAP